MESAKKEVILAIILGLTVGIIGVLFYSGLLKKISLPFFQRSSPAVSLPSPLVPSVSPSKTSPFLTVNPFPFETFSSPMATVSGKTNPSAKILVSSEIEETIVSSLSSGEFTYQLALLPGANQIVISTLSGSDGEVSKDVTIYYFPSN